MSVDGKRARFFHEAQEAIARERFLGVKMGRIPKLVKERALREQKEQQMQQEAALGESQCQSDEGRPRESSCSSSSDRSIENYDPDTMEAGKQLRIVDLVIHARQ
jgi:hypothetical protein